MKGGKAVPKLTIKEIAKIAGVSPSAVSIVLNNRKGVSDKTRENVKHIVDTLEYIPNQTSRRLLFNKTNNIAILFKKNMSPMDHMFHSELTSAILNECENHGYNLMFASMSVGNNSVQFSNAIKSRDVDGVIIYNDIEPFVLDSLNKLEIPCIIVDCHPGFEKAPCVCADYKEAAYTATKYLISLGHDDIAYIGNSSIKAYGLNTFSGFKKAVEENMIPLPINWLQMEAVDEETAYSCMQNILSYKQIPSAIFCASDIYALGVLHCIKDSGLSVPDDISIIGIDDILLSSYIEPALTTIKIDKVKMGRLAIEMLLKTIEKQAVENITIESNELILRKSTKKHVL